MALTLADIQAEAEKQSGLSNLLITMAGSQFRLSVIGGESTLFDMTTADRAMSPSDFVKQKLMPLVAKLTPPSPAEGAPPQNPPQGRQPRPQLLPQLLHP